MRLEEARLGIRVRCLSGCLSPGVYDFLFVKLSSFSLTPRPHCSSIHFFSFSLSIFPSSTAFSKLLKRRKNTKVNTECLENKHGNKLILRHRVKTKAVTATRTSRSLLFICAHCKVSGPFNKRPRSISSNFCDFSSGNMRKFTTLYNSMFSLELHYLLLSFQLLSETKSRSGTFLL